MIRTSCFKDSKDKAHTVSIARNDFPWPMKEYRFVKYPDLMPSLSLHREWRAGKITEEAYTKRYYLPFICIKCISFKNCVIVHQ